MTRTFLSLGSNMGDSWTLLQEAVASLDSVVAVSPVYRTEPVGDAAGHRQTQQRSGRDRQQQDAQHARREIKDLPDIGHPRHPGREREAVHGKDEKIPVAGRDDRLRRGRRVGLLGWCSHD